MGSKPCKEVQQTINAQWTIYSATTILEKCRKVVLEKWFCKLGFFDRDARRSGPTIHFEVDPNIEFVEAYRSLQIGL